ncbi:MAG: ATP-binding cassette domain-containing protein [Nitrospinota bacterium]|nr:ATP-binding cassette domain-containing protein [Nitrospinota bacterium]
MSESRVAIKAQNLRKDFSVDESGQGFLGSVKALFNRRKKIIHAVENVTFSINRGEFVGYVGENGAGKSTTIKMLTGILVPTSGSAHVNGIIPYENRRQNAFRIGVVFGQRTQLWWDLPVRESFEMLRNIYRVTPEDFKTTMKRLNTALDLDPLLQMPVRKLSLGQRMRCDIAAALIHKPEILFLDEPTIGLDVVAKENIRTFLAETNRENGTTIILTTHDMNDIEKLCRRIIILDQGKVIYDGETDALKKKFAHEKVLEVDFHETEKDLSRIPELSIIREEGNKKWLKFENGPDHIGEIIGKLAQQYRLRDISVREPSVESIIRNIYEKRVALPEHVETETQDAGTEPVKGARS